MSIVAISPLLLQHLISYKVQRQIAQSVLFSFKIVNRVWRESDSKVVDESNLSTLCCSKGFGCYIRRIYLQIFEGQQRF